MKKKILKPEKTKDKSIEIVYSYKEVQNSAQNALEKYLSNMNKKVWFFWRIKYGVVQLFCE